MTKIKNIAVALSAIVLTAGTTYAGNTNPVNNIVVDESVSDLMVVNYKGEDASYLYFEVTVRTGNNKQVSLSVNDSEEGELYAANFRADKKQTLKIEKKYNQELDFSIKAGNKSFSKTFTVIPTVQLEVIKK